MRTPAVLNVSGGFEVALRAEVSAARFTVRVRSDAVYWRFNFALVLKGCSVALAVKVGTGVMAISLRALESSFINPGL